MKLWLRLGAALATGIISALLGATSFMQEAEMRLSDQWLRLQGPVPPPPGFLVVALDETSYRELNIPFDKPWPRERHAQMIQRLKQLGASRVVFDVLFMGSGSDAKGDAMLTQAFAALDSVIGVELSSRYVGAQGGGYVVEDLEQPHEPFRAVTTQALVNLTPLNGAIRNFPFSTSELAQRFPFLAQAAVAGRDSALQSAPDRRDLIRYYGPARTFPIYSVWELLDEKMPIEESRFKGATVFVGLLLRSGTGGAQKDSYLSPFGGSMIFGVEVHATIAANLASQSWIKRPSATIEALMQGAVGYVGAFATLSLPPVIVASLLGGLALTWMVASYLLLGSGIFLSGAFVVVGILPLLLLAKALAAYVVTRRSEQTLRSAISLYVSPGALPQLEKDGASLSLGGEKVWVTALFTDIVDFTRITEEMPAEKTTEMLNAYFTEVMDVVFQNEGTLLKFIGDAVFAIWGAPIKVVNHAERAVTTAKAIARGVDKFNASGRFPTLHTRIGVHTGPMLVGNLGSAKRFDYTAIGDSVNLASRVEGLNKYFGTTILFTESTRRDAGGIPGSTFMGSVHVKGRREAVALYSTFEPPLSPDIEQRWATALKSFKSASFQQALTSLTSLAQEEVRLSTAAHLYLEECAKYNGRTPPMGWDGEIYFDSK